jgi:hypothetical protein
MQAWVSALGKPLLCIIEGANGLCGYRFDDDASQGIPVSQVERFDDFLVALDSP